MPAILSTIAIVMGPAKMMDHASVMLDFSTMTVPVNSKRTFIIDNVCALPGFLILLTKACCNHRERRQRHKWTPTVRTASFSKECAMK